MKQNVNKFIEIKVNTNYYFIQSVSIVQNAYKIKLQHAKSKKFINQATVFNKEVKWFCGTKIKLHFMPNGMSEVGAWNNISLRYSLREYYPNVHIY